MIGEWGASIAGKDPEMRSALDHAPGPMCPKIDKWAMAGGRYSATKLWRQDRYGEDMDDLYSTADSIASERDDAFNGLEECRTALDALRTSTVALAVLCDERRDTVSSLEDTIAAKDQEIADLTARVLELENRP